MEVALAGRGSSDCPFQALLYLEAGPFPSSLNHVPAWCFPSQTAILRRQGRYRCSTVPANAQEEAQTLFVTEVMCFFYTNLCHFKSFFSNASSSSLNFNGVVKKVSER